MMFIYGLLAFLFFFSLVNLINTLMTNLIARQQEFGILQSVGLSDKQLSKMLTMECFCYVAVTLFGWLFVSDNFRENRNLRTISISVSNLGIACFCCTTYVRAGTLLNIRHPFYTETIISRAN